jgi:hypothetical protein
MFAERGRAGVSAEIVHADAERCAGMARDKFATSAWTARNKFTTSVGTAHDWFVVNDRG